MALKSVAAGLRYMKEQIAAAAARAGRDPGDVTLVAVTKTVGVGRIREAVAAGHVDFGENRAQEAVEKHQMLGDAVRWHFVGRLQRNKVRKVVRFVHLIHSMDRVGLAEEIDKRAEDPVDVLIELNLSGEASKAGVAPGELPGLIEAVAGLDRVKVRGLMTMAPATDSPEEVRPLFKEAASLREQIDAGFPELGIHHLSMGMSQDYVVAVEEGATILRVGEAIFGPRPGH